MPAPSGSAIMLAAVIAAALVASSRDNSGGFGTGMDYGARWGGGAAGPPVFAGGPSR